MIDRPLLTWFVYIYCCQIDCLALQHRVWDMWFASCSNCILMTNCSAVFLVLAEGGLLGCFFNDAKLFCLVCVLIHKMNLSAKQSPIISVFDGWHSLQICWCQISYNQFPWYYNVCIGVKTEYMDLDYMGNFLWPASILLNKQCVGFKQ